MKRVALVLFAVAFLLAGCPATAPRVKDASFTEETLNKDGTRVTVTKTADVVHNEIVKDLVSRPLVRITCPPTGCIMASFEVAQPIQGQMKDLIYQPKEAPPELHPAAQVVREFMTPVKDFGLAVGPAWIIGGVAKAGYAALKDFGTTAVQSVQAPAGTSIAVTGSSGVGIGGSGSTSSVDSHNTSSVTTTTDNSQKWALDIACTFAMTNPAGSPPAYCSQR